MTEKDQQIADRLNLGAHQHLIEAEWGEGASGRWVVHRPTLRDEVQIGVNYALLRTPPATAENPTPEPLSLDDDRTGLAFMIASLNVVTDLRPEWAPKDWGELTDPEIILKAFALYEEWRNSFRRGVPG